PIHVAAYIITEAAEGLHYAHTLCTDDGRPLNVVHCDVSPANIIVTRIGGIKVVDFGIAKHDLASAQTSSGGLKGKLSYMSPEQTMGDDIDRRSDIFSLGTVFYELLTLSPCFQRPAPIQTIDAVRSLDMVPIAEARPDVPASVERILLRMLAAKPENRFAFASEVAVSLRQSLSKTRPATAREVGEFFAALGDDSQQGQPRCYTAVSSSIELPVSDDLAAPTTVVDARTFKSLLNELAEISDTIEDRSTADLLHEAEVVDLRSAKTLVTPLPESFSRPPSVVDHVSDWVHSIGFRRRRILSSTKIIRFLKSVIGGAERLRTMTPQQLIGLIGFATVVLAFVVVAILHFATPDSRPTRLPPTDVEEVPAVPVPAPDARRLKVVTEPDAALVYLDGKLQLGTTPVTLENLSPELAYHVRVEKPGYQTVRRTHRFDPSDPATVMVVIPLVKDGATAASAGPVASTPTTPPAPTATASPRPASPPAPSPPDVAPRTPAEKARPPVKVPKTGILSLDSQPRTEVTIGKRAVGNTPLRGYRMPTGTHSVHLRNGKLGLLKTIQVTIRPGKTTSRKVVFEKGKVIIDVKPWADVYLHGKKIGTTPMRAIELYEGTYQLKLVNPKLSAERTVRITVRAKEMTKVVEKF
ncbi:MAG: serine/threonine-protein kinase, partial [Myxococcota bacterium]